MKIKLIPIIFLFPLFAQCQIDKDLVTSISYDWDQLEQNDKEQIKKASETYLKKLVKNDIEDFWELCHSKFKKNTPFLAFKEVGTIISNMVNNFDSLEFIDGKKVVFSNAPNNSQFVTGGSLDKSNPTYLQFYTLAGIENQALSIYKLKNKPLSKIITIKFGLEDSGYKLTNFDINTCSINSKDNDYYIKIADKWKSKKDLLPRFVALNMAYRLSYMGKGTMTSKMIEITDSIKTLQKNTYLIKEVKEWNIDKVKFDIINIDFIETQNEIAPNIIYLSKVELGEVPTEKEVKVLFKYFKERYPDLVKEFKQFSFTAYKEYPALATKQYEYFRVIMNSDDE